MPFVMVHTVVSDYNYSLIISRVGSTLLVGQSFLTELFAFSPA